MKGKLKVKNYHSPVWSEPIIMEMGREGERGILVPQAGPEIEAAIGDVEKYIPATMRRKKAPRLPELAQPQVLRHFLRLTQECLGMELDICLGQGTDTMKYSPKINESLARLPQVTEMHPFQDEDTMQGILEIIYKFDLICREISGMDQFTFQPGGGTQATHTNAAILRAYHAAHGQIAQRNEVISSVFSHPCNTATPRAAGFKVINLMPDENGYPNLAMLKAACSEHTAGLMITNPEDTGIYNPRIAEYVEAVHKSGGLCFYDQANLNGLLGIARARDAGFDACHFNLHKTFSSPHGSFGPACGAYGVKAELAKYLPVPIVTFDSKKYHLEYNRPQSIGKVKEFFGNFGVVLRAYAWVMSMGAGGLLEAARTSVLNNNYLTKLLLAVPGVTRPYAQGKFRLDQTRFSMESLKQETTIGSSGVAARLTDFGITDFFTSHEPRLIPEPFTPEPTETYSKEDCDYWVAVVRKIVEEARSNPDTIRTAPHNSTIHQIKPFAKDDPRQGCMTWRAYQRKSREVK
jgi:glycine dehydrogenase subunit 2